jgi:hypothetical protein
MKTHNQTKNNYSSIHTNYKKAMKTKKYSILKKAVVAALLSFVFGTFLNAQFSNPTVTVPQTGEEVRSTSAGNAITYNLLNPIAGEEYRWVVIGGDITSDPYTTDGDSLIVDWTADLDQITVDWNIDLSTLVPPVGPIDSSPGEIIVQKRNAGGCYSTIQVLPMTLWNPATANIVEGDIEVCSGDAIGGTITINLTGAPDPVADGFEVIYDIVATDLTDLGGNPLDVTDGTAVTNNSSVTIALPDGLVNAATADRTFTVTLTSMHDDFDGAGSLIDDEYIITVHPTPVTGEIQSSSSLTRR